MGWGGTVDSFWLFIGCVVVLWTRSERERERKRNGGLGEILDAG